MNENPRNIKDITGNIIIPITTIRDKFSYVPAQDVEMTIQRPLSELPDRDRLLKKM